MIEAMEKFYTPKVFTLMERLTDNGRHSLRALDTYIPEKVRYFYFKRIGNNNRAIYSMNKQRKLVSSASFRKVDGEWLWWTGTKQQAIEAEVKEWLASRYSIIELV